jgi:hypothetical protein
MSPRLVTVGLAIALGTLVVERPAAAAEVHTRVDDVRATGRHYGSRVRAERG